MNTLTTTLTTPTYTFLQQESATRKLPKNKILEEALHLYKKLKKSKSIRDSYQQLNTLAADDEIFEFSEQDLDFFTQQY